MYSKLILEQRDYFKTLATRDVKFRIAQLKKLSALLKSKETELLGAIYKDFGKSAYETYLTELGMTYQEINVAIRNLSFWAAPKKVPSNLANFPSSNYIYAEPYGVCLVIGAWNYPIQLSLIPMVSAMAAGNTVIVKPSELSANVSKVLTQIVNEAFEANYLHFVEGGVAETTALLAERFDKIFFTGSVPVGRIVYQAAAKHLTPVTLELGGKSPAIVLKDCNLKLTAQRLVWGKFLNAGQTCVAPDYLLVEESIKEQLLDALRNEITTRYQFDNGLPENYVQMINDRNFERVLSLIDPLKVAIGGKYNRELRIIEPTVLDNVSWEDKVMQDEIFGPVLPIIGFKSLDEAIRKVIEGEKPLALYVFTSSNKLAKRILTEISFGGGAVNDTIMHLSNGNLPFGGVGNSGIGSYHEEAGFNAFSHQKSVLRRLSPLEIFIKYKPYTKVKMVLLRFIFEKL
jgi:aldehyde dehydrogenase (NAD+)